MDNLVEIKRLMKLIVTEKDGAKVMVTTKFLFGCDIQVCTYSITYDDDNSLVFSEVDDFIEHLQDYTDTLIRKNEKKEDAKPKQQKSAWHVSNAQATKPGFVGEAENVEYKRSPVLEL